VRKRGGPKKKRRKSQAAKLAVARKAQKNAKSVDNMITTNKRVHHRILFVGGGFSIKFKKTSSTFLFGSLLVLFSKSGVWLVYIFVFGVFSSFS
jgi:hypothetical protein